MRPDRMWFPGILAVGTVAVAAAAASRSPRDEPPGTSVTVQLCDGQTTAALVLKGPPTREDGQQVAASLMAAWLANHPSARWEAPEEVPPASSVQPPADNRGLLQGGQSEDSTYRAITELDVLTWERETYAFAREGAAVFHDAGRLGSTIAVSCDMCHPDASNTHPETYPKFQTQLGKVALLRDMINWCIEHPVRGPKLEADDPRMRALEAYILAQRKGQVLDYGKH